MGRKKEGRGKLWKVLNIKLLKSRCRVAVLPLAE
jgi:hypothetical protein